MADISSYLAAIMAAVYGEDVRGSIHDAIEIINDVSEVVLNTGTAVTGPTSSSTGFYKDSFYINTSTMELWKCIGTDAWQSQGVLKGADGADGNGIVSIVKTATVGLVDTYTITYDDGNTTTYDVTNGQNGSKWYKGTAISGTGTSITGFPGVINDFYLNSSTGYVYTCTKTGGSLLPDAAEWDYVMTLTGGGGSSVTVVDNLNSTSGTDALSANQGHVLNTNKIDNPTTKSSGQVLTYDGTKWVAQTPTTGVTTLSALTDTNITTPSNDQVLKYDGANSKWVNGAAPAGGHTMIPNNTAITSLTAKATDNTDDDVASGYAIANWSNAEITTLIAHIDSGDDTVGAWNDAWKTDGIRTGWVWHECLYDIVSDNEVEISIDFDVAGEEVVGLYAYRVDDNVQNGGVDGGAIAIKLTSPIQNASGVDVAINLKRQRTNLVTNPTILS